LCKRFVNFLRLCGFAGVTISQAAKSLPEEQGHMLKRTLWALLVLLYPVGAQASGELLMVAPLNHTMPLAQFENDKLSGGILKDLGEAIARRMGRSIAFISVAGDHVSAVLAQGKADGICYVRPFWIDGDFHWSRPLMPDAELVASLPDAPVVRSLLDLRDRPVGTVTAYRYPRVEQVLGLRFQREDSPTMEENLRKLTLGTVRYTVISQLTMDYQLRVNKALKLRPNLVYASFSAQCAFSKRGTVPFGEIDKAINSLIDDGSVEATLARYR
jgi:polar amino acid transport system substrate-binding protein